MKSFYFILKPLAHYMFSLLKALIATTEAISNKFSRIDSNLDNSKSQQTIIFQSSAQFLADLIFQHTHKRIFLWSAPLNKSALFTVKSRHFKVFDPFSGSFQFYQNRQIQYISIAVNKTIAVYDQKLCSHSKHELFGYFVAKLCKAMILINFTLLQSLYKYERFLISQTKFASRPTSYREDKGNKVFFPRLLSVPVMEVRVSEETRNDCQRGLEINRSGMIVFPFISITSFHLLQGTPQKPVTKLSLLFTFFEKW